jgi:predicted O-methyltransferase YrrM
MKKNPDTCVLRLTGIASVVMDTPWMTESEIRFVECAFASVQPKRVLEWGAGASTFWFSTLLKQTIGQPELWLSVEHDREWAERVSRRNENNWLHIAYAAPNSEKPVAWNMADYRDYLERPSEDGPYDLILVDGRARSACLSVTRTLLRPGGLVLLHDANRPHYLPALLRWPQRVVHRDWRLWAGGVAALAQEPTALEQFRSALHTGGVKSAAT